MSTDSSYTDWDRDIDDARTELFGALTDTINTLTRAQRATTRLAGPLYDPEYAEGVEGSDTAAFIADSLRYTRAAYAIIHRVIDADRE